VSWYLTIELTKRIVAVCLAYVHESAAPRVNSAEREEEGGAKGELPMSAILVAPHPQDLTTATATTNNNNTMAAFYGGGQGDFLQAVVADVGQAYTKVGWAGTDTPKAYFRSVRV
jgi:hypothetical protein